MTMKSFCDLCIDHYLPLGAAKVGNLAAEPTALALTLPIGKLCDKSEDIGPRGGVAR